MKSFEIAFMVLWDQIGDMVIYTQEDGTIRGNEVM